MVTYDKKYKKNAPIKLRSEYLYQIDCQLITRSNNKVHLTDNQANTTF